jgi:hypothetical protein
MSRVRNLYVYGVCAVALLFFATGIENLIRLLIQTVAGASATGWLWLNAGNLRQQLSFFIALTIISGPVWLGHWWVATREESRIQNPESRSRDGPRTLLLDSGFWILDSSSSPIRRFYLYLVMAGALLFFVPGIINLIRIPIWALLGADLGEPYATALAAPIGLVAVTIPIWLYHRRLAGGEESRIQNPESRRENEARLPLLDSGFWILDSSPAGGSGGTSRRLYFYLAAFVTANFLLVNEARLGTMVWHELSQPSLVVGATLGAWAGLALPAFAVAGLVFLAVWWWHWSGVEAVAASDSAAGAAERASLLRRLYLYSLILIGLVVVLVNASTVLNDLLRALLGAPAPAGDGASLVDALGQPVVWGLVYGAFLLNLRWWLQRDAARATEAEGQGALRRLYAYLVAAVGLIVFVIGLVSLLSTLLGLPTITPEQLAAGWFRDRISQAVTLVLIGGPLWLGYWLAQQRQVARAPAAERASLWRRVYLYLALFAGVIAILVAAASVLYQLILLLVGDRSTTSLLDAIRTPLSVVLVVGALVAYHWQSLRADQQQTAAPGESPPEASATIVLRGPPAEVEATLRQFAGLASDRVKVQIRRDD